MFWIPVKSAGIIYSAMSAFMLLGGIYDKNPTFIILDFLGTLWGDRVTKCGIYETVFKDRLAITDMLR